MSVDQKPAGAVRPIGPVVTLVGTVTETAPLLRTVKLLAKVEPN
jgi:hypothetical protein